MPNNPEIYAAAMRRASCEGKVGIPSAALAKKAMKHNKARREHGVTCYRCKHCGMWHIGTPTGKNRKKMKEMVIDDGDE